MKPLQEMHPTKNMGILNRVQGMFASYAKWIPEFLDKIHPLVKVNQFTLNKEALHAFESLKSQLCRTTEENLPFEVDCDALNNAISAVLIQNGRPVTFLSKTL